MAYPHANPWKNVPYVGQLIDDHDFSLDPANALQWADMIGYDTLSNRPAAGIEGRLFYATNEDIWYRDNGSTWNATSSPPPVAADVAITDSGGYYSSTDVEGALQEAGAEMTGATRIAVDLRAPDPGGNCFPTVTALTAWNNYHWELVKDVTGYVDGIVKLPTNVTVAAQKVVLELMANATSGVTRFYVQVAAVADGESMNPASLAVIQTIDTTVPGTARYRKKVSFTDGTNTWTPGDILIVRVVHDGAHTNDTLAVNTELLGAWVELA